MQKVRDEDWHIRAEVASQGYGLDKLINDESYIVREAVAEQGYGLDILVNDKSVWVREAVAKQGYKLDMLINDESPAKSTATKNTISINLPPTIPFITLTR